LKGWGGEKTVSKLEFECREPEEKSSQPCYRKNKWMENPRDGADGKREGNSAFILGY